MPTRRFVQDEFFDPDLIEVMSGALMDACMTMGLQKNDTERIRVLANRILSAARAGLRARHSLKVAALKGAEN